MKKILLILSLVSLNGIDCSEKINHNSVEQKLTKEQQKEVNKMLFDAVDDEDLEEALNAGADVNSKDKYGQTPLMWASRRGHRDIVEILIKAGANVNVKDNHNMTALIEASINDRQLSVGLLIEAGADLNAKYSDGRTALMHASFRGKIDIVEILIRAGVDLNAIDNNGQTALHVALHWYSPRCRYVVDIIEILIKSGTDLNAKDNEDKTALMLASHYGFKDIVEILIKGGANIDAKSIDSETALMFASGLNKNFHPHLPQIEYKDIVELLTMWAPYSQAYYNDKANKFKLFSEKCELNQYLINDLSNIVMGYLEPSFQEWINAIYANTNIPKELEALGNESVSNSSSSCSSSSSSSMPSSSSSSK